MDVEEPLPLSWTLPQLDRFNEAWFTSGAMRIQRCDACGVRQHPPEEVCHGCGSFELGSEELAATGVVHSYTVAHYAVHRALADHVPYAVVLVSLDDDPSIRILGNVLGVAPSAVHIGMRMAATWVDRHDEHGAVRLLQWRAVL